MVQKALTTGMLFVATVFTQVSLAQSNGVLELIFTYGSEKMSWFGYIDKKGQKKVGVLDRFNEAKIRTTSGKIIRVTSVPKGSGDIVDELMDKNGPVVHLASPASDLYLNLANDRYSRAKGQKGATLLQKQGDLVQSPVVIAMWEPEARKLGWPKNQIGWLDIMNRAATDPSFRFGHTHPGRSNSGLSAVVAQFFAGATRADQRVMILEKSHVLNPQVLDFVKQVQNSVVYYGPSTGFYAETMVEQGPQAISAAVIYESDVVTRNQQIREMNRVAQNASQKRPKLVAIYPREGTFVANHPVAIVNREWMTDEIREASNKVIEFLLEKQQQKEALKDGFQPSIAESFDDSSVFSEQNGIYSQKAKKVLPSPKGEVIDAILANWFGSKKRSFVTIVVDRSGSMGDGDKLAQAKQGALEVLKDLNENDRLHFISFDDRIEVGTSRGAIATDVNGKAWTQKAINDLYPRGGTHLYRSIQRAHEIMCSAENNAVRNRNISAILVLTDGVDTSSDSLNELIEQVGFIGEGRRSQNCRIPIFTVAYEANEAELSLTQISKATGARMVKGTREDIKKILRDFATYL